MAPGAPKETRIHPRIQDQGSYQRSDQGSRIKDRIKDQGSRIGSRIKDLGFDQESRILENEHPRRYTDMIFRQSKAPLELFNSRWGPMAEFMLQRFGYDETMDLDDLFMGLFF